MKTALDATAYDYTQAWQKSLHDPGSLSDADLSVIGHYDRSREGRARAARDAAIHPPADRPVAATRDESAVEVYGTVILKLVEFTESMNERNKERNEKIAALEDKNAALERRLAELESRDLLHDAGDWTDGKFYATGAAVRSHGSIWTCRENHYSTGTDLDHTKFRLWIKRPAR